jgi:hypothetical protein
MKGKNFKVKNPVAKHAHTFNKAKVQEDELKAMSKRACRGNKPGSMFWLI